MSRPPNRRPQGRPAKPKPTPARVTLRDYLTRCIDRLTAEKARFAAEIAGCDARLAELEQQLQAARRAWLASPIPTEWQRQIEAYYARVGAGRCDEEKG